MGDVSLLFSPPFKYSSDPFFEVCRPHISDESEIKVTEGLTWVVRIKWWVRRGKDEQQLRFVLFCPSAIFAYIVL